MGYKGIKNVGQVELNCAQFGNFQPGYFVIGDDSVMQELLNAHTVGGVTGYSLYPQLTAMPSYIAATVAGWSNFAPYIPFHTDPAWPTMVF